MLQIQLLNLIHKAPIYGMPVLDVEKSKSVLFVKEVCLLDMQVLTMIYFIEIIL